jgi:hypothetical protein
MAVSNAKPAEETMATRTTRKQPAPDIVNPEDRALLETPAGRENDSGADPGTLAEDEIRHPEVGAVPMSTITGRHDDGSGANETVDGLDEIQEAVRHAAEDVPASERGENFDDLPVFDRAEAEPKV